MNILWSAYNILMTCSSCCYQQQDTLQEEVAGPATTADLMSSSVPSLAAWGHPQSIKHTLIAPRNLIDKTRQNKITSFQPA